MSKSVAGASTFGTGFAFSKSLTAVSPLPTAPRPSSCSSVPGRRRRGARAGRHRARRRSTSRSSRPAPSPTTSRHPHRPPGREPPGRASSLELRRTTDDASGTVETASASRSRRVHQREDAPASYLETEASNCRRWSEWDDYRTPAEGPLSSSKPSPRPTRAIASKTNCGGFVVRCSRAYFEKNSAP